VATRRLLERGVMASTDLFVESDVDTIHTPPKPSIDYNSIVGGLSCNVADELIQ
jgi:hypothetical protein